MDIPIPNDTIATSNSQTICTATPDNETAAIANDFEDASPEPHDAPPRRPGVPATWSSELITRPGKMFQWARRSTDSTRKAHLTTALDQISTPLPRDTLFLQEIGGPAERAPAAGLPNTAFTDPSPSDFKVADLQPDANSSQNRSKSDPSTFQAPRQPSHASIHPIASDSTQATNQRTQSSSPPNLGITKKYLANVDSLLGRTLASDQQASLNLQQMLKNASPSQRAALQREIIARMSQMVSSRFGNFVVQRMLEVSDPSFVENEVFLKVKGQVATLSLNAFACYVLQKLLDVGSQSVRQQILDEMLAQVVETITNASGTHVWQKLLHLPWPESLPNVVKQVSAALDAAFAMQIAESGGGDCSGWMYILQYPPGAAAARSLIGASHLPGAAQVLNRLSQSMNELIANPELHSIPLRMAQSANIYRDRVIEHVLLHADEYTRDRELVPFLNELLAHKIPGFAEKLRASIFYVPPELDLALES
ncbi:Pumilio 6, chloroplastic [Wickerhamiella sorbophila]|uniref:Pumilio 6, chloroplastic n=1 Tax=Wickerhamiella sorbophila TaxID=45607 RepID=A0A2T0FCY9_9ASCO|nr:Pumilio 6, chloroplastic [Wickerhamiella sorbophila]PRT52830.1 Pumilio 6, chloroplastic [Wickerhamiella sorbophila]